MLHSYKELDVWRKAYELCLLVYDYTKDFPKEERYGLTSQMKRAVVSIPSNISEGYCRHSRKEYMKFVDIAYASGSELETQILLSIDLKLGNQKKGEKILSKIDEAKRMLNGLYVSLGRVKVLPGTQTPEP